MNHCLDGAACEECVAFCALRGRARDPQSCQIVAGGDRVDKSFFLCSVLIFCKLAPRRSWSQPYHRWAALPTMPADPFIASMLSALSSSERESAWRAFLDRHSGLIYQVARSFDRDPDRSGNCFLFICEQLSANDFRRLRKFDVGGRASFSTWLNAVVRNLCLDWHRKEHGRHRVFGSVARRSATEQLLFELVFRRGFSSEEAREELSRQGIEVSFAAVEGAICDLRRCLSSRQVWLLSSGNRMLDSFDGEEERSHAIEPPDPAPDPEALVTLRETHRQVSAALASLCDSDRLLIRLRYQEGLTLQQVAKLVGLKDPQTADRRLREIIEKIRQALGIEYLARGKAKPASV